MIHVTELNTNRRKVLAIFPTFDTAFAAVSEGRFGEVIYLEADDDFADCADVYTRHGQVLAIQPADFSLKG
jgi:hypothetical protein